MRSKESESVCVAGDGVFEESQQSSNQFFGVMGRGFDGLVSFVSDEDLFLISGSDDVALGTNRDEVVFAEIFPDESHFAYLRDDSSDVDVFLGDGLDYFVVVGLEVLDVLAGDAVFDEVIVPFYSELSELFPSFCFSQLENVGQFLVFTVIFQNASAFFFIEQSAAFLVQSALIIVQHAQVFNHLDFMVVVSQHHCQSEGFPSIESALLVVFEGTVQALNFNADGQGQLFEVELTAIVLAESVVLDLPLQVSGGVQTAQLVKDQVESQMHQPVTKTLAQSSLQLFQFAQELFRRTASQEEGEALHLFPDALPLLGRNQLDVINQAFLEVVEAVLDSLLVFVPPGLVVLVVEVGCAFATGAGTRSRLHGLAEVGAVATARSAGLLFLFEEVVGLEEVQGEIFVIDERCDFLKLETAQLHYSKKRISEQQIDLLPSINLFLSHLHTRPQPPRHDPVRQQVPHFPQRYLFFQTLQQTVVLLVLQVLLQKVQSVAGFNEGVDRIKCFGLEGSVQFFGAFLLGDLCSDEVEQSDGKLKVFDEGRTVIVFFDQFPEVD